MALVNWVFGRAGWLYMHMANGWPLGTCADTDTEGLWGLDW